MRRHIIILALLLVSSAAAIAAEDGNSKYQDILGAAKSGQPVDWQAFRFAYAESAGFDVTGMKSAATRKAMNEALRANDYAGAIAQANLILNENYTDIDAHVVSDVANMKLGNTDEAKKQHAIAVGLLRSIRTGDGKTPETAFTVITVHEEYSLIGVLGMRRQRQAVFSNGGHNYDVLDVVDKDGLSQKFYFQIDRVLAAEAALLEHPH
jgi:hypothetical protein